MYSEIATLHEPFDAWFRAFVLEHNGLDLSRSMPGPPPEPVLDWAADEGGAGDGPADRPWRGIGC